MIDTTTLINELIDKVQHDLELSKKLAILLEEERTALEKRSIEQIEAITKKKADIVSAFNENQKSRDSIQQQLGGSPGLTGLKYVLATFKLQQHATFKPILQELEQLLIKIKTMSTINGKIIAISHTQISRVIDIICGRDNALYGEHAQICSAGQSKTIVKA